MKNKLGPNLTFLNIFELKGFRMFATQQKQKCMKNLLLTSLIALLGISSFAQEAKKEAIEWLREYNLDDIRATFAVRAYVRSVIRSNL